MVVNGSSAVDRSRELGDGANRRTLALLLLDFGAVFVAWALALALLPVTGEISRAANRSWALAAGTALLVVGLLRHHGVYAGPPSMPRTDEVAELARAIALGVAGLAVAAAIIDWPLGARELLAGALLAFGLRSVARGIARRFESERAPRTRIAVVGVGSEAADLCQLLTDHPESGFSLAGVVGDRDVAVRYGLSSLWIGPDSDLVQIMEQHRVSSAVLTPTSFRYQRFSQLTSQLFSNGYGVFLSSGVTRLTEGLIAVRSLSHEPLIQLGQRSIHPWQRIVKRSLDVVFAAVALAMLAPLFLMLALAVKIDSRGPVFFKSPRYGKNTEFFYMWKFRSMVADADSRKQEFESQNGRTGPIFKIDSDPRVTRVGRFIRETSLDELPQFFNVLRGDMSLVGPRPALPAEEEAFAGEHRRRFVVRPGITGLWQVEARSNANFSAYRRLDLHYLENWSLGLDAKILLATVEQVAVAIVTLPLRPLLPGAGADGVGDPSADVELDLRSTLDLEDPGAIERSTTAG